MSAKKRSKSVGKRFKKSTRRVLTTDRQRKAAYKRVIANELSEMTMHQLFLTRQAVAKVRFGMR